MKCYRDLAFPHFPVLAFRLRELFGPLCYICIYIYMCCCCDWSFALTIVACKSKRSCVF